MSFQYKELSDKAFYYHSINNFEHAEKIYRQLLVPGGTIWQKTDDEAFFDYSLESYAAEGMDILSVCRDLAAQPFEGNVVTEHEARFMAEGKKIFRAEVRV